MKNFEFYERDGKKYDRITSVLDYFPHPKLVEWKVRVGKKEAGRISKEALRIGKNIDEVIRADINGVKPKKLKTFEAQCCNEAYLKWKRIYNPVLTTPDTVFCDELMVAGTPDFVWEDKSEVIDAKSSKMISSQYWLQTEFYARQLGMKKKSIFRPLKQLGIYEYVVMPVNDKHWEAVKAAVVLYRYYKQFEEVL